MIPLFVATQNLLIKPYVKGFEMNSMELMYLKKSPSNRFWEINSVLQPKVTGGLKVVPSVLS